MYLLRDLIGLHVFKFLRVCDRQCERRARREYNFTQPRLCLLLFKDTLKHATCFATLLLYELKSCVALLTTHESNLFCSETDCRRLRKVVAVSREKFFFFATKSVHVACLTGPRRTCFAASDVTNSRVIVSNQKSVLRQLATT